MKRYSIRADSGASATGANIFESSTGYWVSYADHEAALKAAVEKNDAQWAIAIAEHASFATCKAIADEIAARGAAHD